MPIPEMVRVLPAEQRDEETGKTLIRWTDLKGNDQLLYFTSPSLSHDGRWIVLISDRGGDYNLWALEKKTGIMRRLSDNRDGYVRSYVYFDGRRDGKGFGRASVSFDPVRNRAYWIQGNLIMCADIENGRSRVVAELDPNHVTAFTHVSACGEFICVPTIDRRAFDVTLDPKPGDPWGRNRVSEAADALGIHSHVRVFRTDTGESVLTWEEPGWVTHVQFRPTDPTQILYNHEWARPFSATRRMWLWNGYQSQRLRPADDLVDPRGGAVHEVWCADGRSLIYHGTYFVPSTGPTYTQKVRGIDNGMPYVGRCYPDGDFRLEIPLRTGCADYGHFMPDHDARRVVTDGYFDQPTANALSRPMARSARGKGRWITIFHLDWERLTAEPEPLCLHGSTWASQDEHPHPIFSPDGSSVWFTSDREGRRAVYEVGAAV